MRGHFEAGGQVPFFEKFWNFFAALIDDLEIAYWGRWGIGHRRWGAGEEGVLGCCSICRAAVGIFHGQGIV